MLLHQTKKQYQIPPTRFELVSPDPKSCMIDRYTTGVLNTDPIWSLFPFAEKGHNPFAPVDYKDTFPAANVGKI